MEETPGTAVKPKTKWWLYAILVLVLLLPLLIWFNKPVSNVYPDLSGSGDLAGMVYDYISQLNSVAYVSLLIFTFLISLIPIYGSYFIYRLYGFLIRRMKRDLYFGTGRNLMDAAWKSGAGIIALITGLILIRYYPATWGYGIIGALMLLITATIISVIISLAVILANLAFLLIRSRKNLDITGMKRRILRYSSIMSLGVFILILPAFYLIRSLFGIDLIEMRIQTTGISGVGDMSGVGSSRFSALGSVTNPMLSLGSSGNYKAAENIGFSTGGAKDINNFRENIKNNYLPLETDITYEGLFYDYYFDTGKPTACTELFCPTYSAAISTDPISKNPEYYMSVGLNSGMKASDFSRKKLNLVIVLDVSGSMGEMFNSYYYDNSPKPANPETKTKIKVADEAIVALLNHLTPEDRFGMVVYDDTASVTSPLQTIKKINMPALKNTILQITEQGSTNMEDGYKTGSGMFAEIAKANPELYENRIILLTDAQPNTGDTSETGLAGMTRVNSDKNIYTTFIGIGVDFNTQLIEAITKMRGANYYSVKNSTEFANRMDKGFDYMVTPLVFDLNLKVESDAFEIQKVYGSPEADLSTGEIMKVNTLFPSENTEEGVKGGLILLRLHRKNDLPMNVKISAGYKDRSGKSHTNSQTADITAITPDSYANTGIEKGILLTRYTNFMKDWIRDERQKKHENKRVINPMIDNVNGIVLPAERTLSDWERTSLPLTVDAGYKSYLTDFRSYFDREITTIGDKTLVRERDVLDCLLKI